MSGSASLGNLGGGGQVEAELDTGIEAKASPRCIPEQRETNMAHLRVFNQTKNIQLCSVCKVAQTSHERVRGLLDRTSLQAGEGLLIPKCNSIHTLGMKFPIDVLYLAFDGKVLSWARELPPGYKKAYHEHADSVLELPSGGALTTEAGDQLTFQSF